MVEMSPESEVSTSELVKEALRETRTLVQVEVALAMSEAKKELAALRTTAIMLGVALGAAVTGVVLLFVAIAFAIAPSAASPAILGGLLCVVAAVVGAMGYRAMPKRPLDRTRRRLEDDVKILRERLA